MVVITVPKKGFPITDLTLSGPMTEVAAGPHDMKASAWPLHSGGYSGCFALVAEYTPTGCRQRRPGEFYVPGPIVRPPIVGLLGHYFPDNIHWGRLCHNFEAWHKSLREEGYLMTRVHVFHHVREDPKAQVDKDKLLRIVLDQRLVRFKIYSGKNLDLRYEVPNRLFYFEEKDPIRFDRDQPS